MPIGVRKAQWWSTSATVETRRASRLRSGRGRARDGCSRPPNRGAGGRRRKEWSGGAWRIQRGGGRERASRRRELASGRSAKRTMKRGRLVEGEGLREETEIASAAARRMSAAAALSTAKARATVRKGRRRKARRAIVTSAAGAGQSQARSWISRLCKRGSAGAEKTA